MKPKVGKEEVTTFRTARKQLAFRKQESSELEHGSLNSHERNYHSLRRISLKFEIAASSETLSITINKYWEQYIKYSGADLKSSFLPLAICVVA